MADGREHFVQRHAERVDVGADVDVAVEDLLRRHVECGADLRAGSGEAAGAYNLGDAEVHHFDDALRLTIRFAGLMSR